MSVIAEFPLCGFPPYMGGCIEGRKRIAAEQQVSSLHGRVYRSYMSKHRSLESFLPTWEGVSVIFSSSREKHAFPPYMGGCIEIISGMGRTAGVSSLHGRVYRPFMEKIRTYSRFLPTWEGVSMKSIIRCSRDWFPPYMGGCISQLHFGRTGGFVSSLHGRVYRGYLCVHVNSGSFLPTWEGVSHLTKDSPKWQPFPPYMGGCIDVKVMLIESGCVSSLYGRVYHIIHMRKNDTKCFLPIREGVSWQVSKIMNQRKFPPYTGGCIVYFALFSRVIAVFSLYGRVYPFGG